RHPLPGARLRRDARSRRQREQAVLMAQPKARFPQSYENAPVKKALAAIAAEPSRESLDVLLTAATKGGLVVDLTGSTPQDTRLRTISSTTGEAVLPLFTSMNALRSAVAQTAEGE